VVMKAGTNKTAERPNATLRLSTTSPSGKRLGK